MKPLDPADPELVRRVIFAWHGDSLEPNEWERYLMTKALTAYLGDDPRAAVRAWCQNFDKATETRQQSLTEKFEEAVHAARAEVTL